MKMRSSRLGSMRLRINRVAPLVSIVLMMGGWFLIDNPLGEDSQILRHRAQIAAQMDEFPYQLDNWWGADVPVPTAAMEILRPNSLVSRRFSRLETSDDVVLALIHCSDLRDMVGHYPPVCYPATGWTLNQDAIEDVQVRLADINVQMRLYRFHRFDQDGLEQEQTVLSMFLLPNGLLLTDMQELKGKSTQGRNMSAIGVAQLQMVFADSPETELVVNHTTELLGAVPMNLISALYAPLNPETPSPSNESEIER
jgi:hypothetical protein